MPYPSPTGGYQAVTIPALEGMAIVSYGDSLMGADIQNTAGLTFLDRLAIRHGCTFTDRHVNGSEYIDTRADMYGTAKTWTPETDKGIPMLGSLTAIPALVGPVVTAPELSQLRINHYAWTMESMLHILSAAEIQDSGDGTESGTWGNTAHARYRGGTGRTSSTPGDYVEYTFTGTEVVVPLYTGTSPAEVGELTVQVDGTVVDTFAGQGAVAGPYDTSDPVTTYPMHIKGLTDEAHTVRLAIPAGSVGMVSDGIIVPATDPRPVFVVRDHAFPAARAPGTQAQLEEQLDIVADRFPNVRVIDLPGWNMDTMVGADATHANDRGQAFKAGLVEDYIAGVVDFNANVHV